MTREPAVGAATAPTLLFDGECSVCRPIARWVARSAVSATGESSVVVRPIGDDPAALRALDPELDIWDAYATIHLLMPDGSMKLGGEAVAEVLRDCANTRWFAWLFAVDVAGLRPFQAGLDVGYAILSDVRPLLGCESCGTPSAPVRSARAAIRLVRTAFGSRRPLAPNRHATPLP